MPFKRVDYFSGEISSGIVCLSEIWYTSGLKLPRLEIFPALSEIQCWLYRISTFQRFLFHHNYKRWCYSSNSLVIDLASHLPDLNVDRCSTNQSGVVGLISKWLSRSRRWERYLRGVQPCYMAPCFPRFPRGTRGDAKILEAPREAFWDLIMAFWEFFFERLCRDLQALSEVHNISASSCLGESWTILSDPTGVKRPTWHHGQSACSDLGRYRELLGRRYMHNNSGNYVIGPRGRFNIKWRQACLPI